jgi:hypothetical protein
MQAPTKVIIVFVAILLAVPAVSLAQDTDSDEPITECNPAAQRIVKQFNVTCEEVLAQVNNGYGFGQIMKALYVTNSRSASDGPWQELLVAQESTGIGWGQYKMALRLKVEGTTTDQLLGWKESGYGWGQIKKAIAIAGVTDKVDADAVLAMTKKGMELEWEAIRQSLDLPPGKPPWAGKGKFGSGDMPPGLSGAHGKLKQDKQTGPPEWANNDKETSEDQAP